MNILIDFKSSPSKMRLKIWIYSNFNELLFTFIGHQCCPLYNSNYANAISITAIIRIVRGKTFI